MIPESSFFIPNQGKQAASVVRRSWWIEGRYLYDFKNWSLKSECFREQNDYSWLCQVQPNTIVPIWPTRNKKKDERYQFNYSWNVEKWFVSICWFGPRLEPYPSTLLDVTHYSTETILSKFANLSFSQWMKNYISFIQSCQPF